MLPEHRIQEHWPEPLVLPAGIRHYPIKVVEHARDQVASIALRGGERIINLQAIFAGEVRDYRIAVADRLTVVEDVGKLTTRRGSSIEDMLLPEGHPGQ